MDENLDGIQTKVVHTALQNKIRAEGKCTKCVCIHFQFFQPYVELIHASFKYKLPATYRKANTAHCCNTTTTHEFVALPQQLSKRIQSLDAMRSENGAFITPGQFHTHEATHQAHEYISGDH